MDDVPECTDGRSTTRSATSQIQKTAVTASVVGLARTRRLIGGPSGRLRASVPQSVPA